ncbi:adenylyl-sulfate kinase [Butyrivibrio fibrisolvens]|uniref:Adenylyl-sulfate kinase n=1 Tax=Butyrivibrio fibrisolvens TaxID=831 RepID=A0A317G9K1_BUTFI|nr:adenylyl-sulfate kinase [Butyrivibrio fibrisolvens]PWT29272.1 adenylyl-sulfate kinase [Butyrivibrio fibrisolvens]
MNEEIKKGRLFWITGLSDAGKTTIGGMLFDYIKSKKNDVVWLDGDCLREVYQNRDYSEEGRKQISYSNMRLGKLLTDQGIDVIMSVIGMRDEYREWNRSNIERYLEIYLKVPLEELVKRDSKGLYAKALRGEALNVYGINLAFEEPKSPDLIILNDGRKPPREVLDEIIQKLDL